MMWMCFWLGLAVGVIGAIPVAAIAASRRAARRVQRLEQRARAAERLAELGSMTGGLAHEIKNPLSTIGLNHQLLMEDLDALADRMQQSGQSVEPVTRIRRRFDTVRREADRLRHILEDFLRFAGRMRLDRHPTQINQLIDDVHDFFLPQAESAGVRIHQELLPDLPEVWIDHGLMKQAILNLLVNAVQIMRDTREQEAPSGGCGELILRTDRRRVAGEDEVSVHVIDTGPGIAKEDLDKIFQPYFSKRRGGTGLGLPTTRRIIEEHGGTISVHSATGRGCDFEIRLPIHPPQHVEAE